MWYRVWAHLRLRRSVSCDNLIDDLHACPGCDALFLGWAQGVCGRLLNLDFHLWCKLCLTHTAKGSNAAMVLAGDSPNSVPMMAAPRHTRNTAPRETRSALCVRTKTSPARYRLECGGRPCTPPPGRLFLTRKRQLLILSQI